MTRMRIWSLAAVMGLTLAANHAQAWCHGPGLAIGFNFGAPGYYGPWGYGPYWGYYRPYPLYVAAPPVVVQPAPIVVQQGTAAPVPRTTAAPPAPDLEPVSYANAADIDRNLQLLTNPNDQTRAAAVMELGKSKAVRAVDPVAATLAGDRSPAVREAAARALGLIGSPKGLTALKYAAQADNDRDVRHSAQFAVEVIQSNMKRY